MTSCTIPWLDRVHRHALEDCGKPARSAPHDAEDLGEGGLARPRFRQRPLEVFRSGQPLPPRFPRSGGDSPKCRDVDGRYRPRDAFEGELADRLDLDLSLDRSVHSLAQKDLTAFRLGRQP